jgi:serine/threonine protein kinase
MAKRNLARSTEVQRTKNARVCTTKSGARLWKESVTSGGIQNIEREYSIYRLLLHRSPACASWVAFVPGALQTVRRAAKRCCGGREKGASHRKFLMHRFDGDLYTWRGAALRTAAPNTFSALKAMRAVLAELGQVHQAGIVHNDLKPENICVLRGEKGIEDASFHLIDFGMATVACAADPKHGAFGTLRGSGTLDFTSAHMSSIAAAPLGTIISDGCRWQPTFDDDYESLVYTFVDICTGRLPWDTLGTWKQVAEKKASASVKTICAGCPPCLGVILKRLRYRADLRKTLDGARNGNPGAHFEPEFHGWMCQQLDAAIAGIESSAKHRRNVNHN